MFLFSVLLFVSMTPALDLFGSGGMGYTHYEATDLNKFLVLLERKTNDRGLNPYQVKGFDGHPAQGGTLGAVFGPWRVGLNAEFWVESFRQSEVPFDIGTASRDFRISCADLRNRDEANPGEFGCVQAEEEFMFLPIGLQVSYSAPLPWRFVDLRAGYSLGVMTGYSRINLKTEFFSAGSAEGDEVTYSVDPGINLQHTVFGALEILPIRHAGIEFQGGYRYLKLDEIRLGDKTGSSRVFDALFNNPRSGDILYFESWPGLGAEDEEIFLGTQATAGHGAKLHQVEGDFTGWYVAVKVNVYWRGL